MKKVWAVLLTAAMLLTLCACAGEAPAANTSDGQETSVPAVSDSVSQTDEQAEQLAQLREQLAELQAQLASREQKIADLEYRADKLTEKRAELEKALKTEKETADSLREKIAELEGRLAVKPKGEVIANFWIEGGTVYHTDSTNYREKLYIQHKDGTVTDIYEGPIISYLQISADRTKLIWNDYEWEYNASVWVYDLINHTLVSKPMDDLGDYMTPSYMKWLDSRYFLFVVQYDMGTIALGGDVYVYDTQNDTYRLLIARDTDRLMIVEFDRLWQTDLKNAPLLFLAAMYDEGFAEYTALYYKLDRQEIYALIEQGNTVTLRAEDGF